ncbi:MAG: deoxyribonuclease II family protein [Pseudomonadales bacterium]|nr:deoxyribonuclease II family protein [Pseudomonadales bacterium]
MMEPKNQHGESVDWWFIYKTPEHTGTESNAGFDFLYFDPDCGAINLSSVALNQNNQALAYTLKGIFNAPESAGYIAYNDEHVQGQDNSSEKGHCKGMIGFDKASDTAVLLLHSTPRFPACNEIDLPQDEPLYKLFNGIGIDESFTPSTVTFASRQGHEFRLIAKSRCWGQDFWIDLVSPQLQSDLIVETWRRGAVTPLQDKHSSEFDDDTLNVKFQISETLAYEWHYTKDHAKWAVALKNQTNSQPWVCVADINRMISQEKRGGGSLCFQDSRLWQALRDAEEKIHQLAGKDLS